MNKKLYRVTDNGNNFKTVCYTTEEDIQKFGAFIEKLFGNNNIAFEEIATAENCLYRAYANYLADDGFEESCKKEIEMLEGVQIFLNIQ